jgi:hypothetical protein
MDDCPHATVREVQNSTTEWRCDACNELFVLASKLAAVQLELEDQRKVFMLRWEKKGEELAAVESRLNAVTYFCEHQAVDAGSMTMATICQIARGEKGETWSLGRPDVKEAYENYKPPVVENRDHKSERKTFRDPAKTAVESQRQFGLSRWDRPEVKAEEAEKTAAMRGRVDALLDATCEHGKRVREWCDECEKALGRM